MKRLWAFVSIAVLLVGGFSVFDAPKVFGQTASQASVSNEQLIQHVGNGIFKETQLALTNEKRAITGRQNTPQYQTELQTNAAEVAALVQARSAFEAYLMSNESIPAEQRYSGALQAANMALVQFQQTNPALQQGTGQTFITKLTNQLGAESGKTEWIRAITTGQALSAESQQAANATKATANPSKPDPAKTGKCTWSNFTISDCIDEGFTWLIKNTLLQMGGFFVWLTANLLNYAIQVSILDFKSWAPDTLYPIWVIVRQIVSLFVVFAGLYLGFMYIIGRTEAFGKYVGWLVLFALFVNFSYPFSRALVDVSNIVSLNIYSAAVGPKALTTSFTTAATTLGQDTAGAQIMNRLGLYGLVASATSVKEGQTEFVKSINSIPGALLAVAFVFYAAYIFFMATAIIVTRTIILIFLTVASPLLLVDSVIPKLGEAAVKMRKMFFEQLVVAPVFMIMLALTLKFMEIFQAGPNSHLKTGAAGTLTGGADSIQTFFSILMMLIMLHIMIKVTKEVAGQAGEYATNFMGKVGGFGLGVAAGGAGVLARGTIGAAAARFRDSDGLRNMQDSRVGRSLFTLSNSLAQSTYDVRNVDAVSSRMAKTSMGMGAGLKQNYDQRFKAREEEVRKKSAYIKDADVRGRYLDQQDSSVASVAQKGFLKAVGFRGSNAKSDAELIREKMGSEREKILKRYNAYKDEDRKREFLESQSDDIQTYLKNYNKPTLLTETPKGVAPAPSEPVDNLAANATASKSSGNTPPDTPDADQTTGTQGPIVGPGGSDTTPYEDTRYNIPAYERAGNAKFPPIPEPNVSTVPAAPKAPQPTQTEPAPGFLLSGAALKAYNEKRRAAKTQNGVPTAQSA